jgi:hypothetical protein
MKNQKTAYVQRAAENTALSAVLESFKWLETQGLNKNAHPPLLRLSASQSAD